MLDIGQQATERAFADVQRRLKRNYRQAVHEMQDKLDTFNAHYRDADLKMRKKLKDGKITKTEYKQWQRGKVFQSDLWQKQINNLTETLYTSDVVSQRIVNGERINVFASNANAMAYSIEHGEGYDFGFGYYDSATVARILKEQPNLLPPRIVKRKEDVEWYHKLIDTSITQGIIQGEGIPEIARRIAETTGERALNAAVRNARTAMTSAQNAGRLEVMHEAQRMGIKVKKRWMATLDARTRDAHRDLDGQEQDVDAPFESDLGDILFPGDPAAEPALVYNCRCTMTYVHPEYPSSFMRRDNISGESIEWMTYRQWEGSKKAQTLKIITAENVSPGYIRPVNPITDQSKVEALAYDFVEKGYDGRPILAIDNGDGSYQALTGSHRIFAAREAGIDVPTKILERNESSELIEAANDDESRVKVAMRLYSEGKIDSDTLALLKKEEDMNYDDTAVIDKEEKAKKWREKREKDQAMLEGKKHEAAEKQKEEEEKRLGSPEMQEYLSFRQAMIDKYGEDNMYSDMTDNEYDKLERLERIAYKGKLWH